MVTPRILVYSSLFPSQADPTAGVFIRERLFRVAQHLPIVVVSPRAWSPFDSLIRRFRPRFRPMPARQEQQQGITVYYPRFLSLPGLFKTWDSLFMALGSYLLIRRLHRDTPLHIIDAHFGYPDGHAASLVARWLRLPLTITLRGNERTYVETPAIRRRIVLGMQRAARVFSVSEALRQLALRHGINPAKTRTIPNAVDSQRFHPVDRAQARAQLGLPPDAPVLISVGWLIERKGFHRVIDCLPALRQRHPNLRYLLVGGDSGAEGMEASLRKQVADLGLEQCVIFTGPQATDALKTYMSAADVFVLATRREGWANVFLEAMACGLPVITTDVDGNAEVVCRPELGSIVPFGNQTALTEALDAALSHPWDRASIRSHAESQSWDHRVAELCGEFRALAVLAK
jgi:glycosyltransferase involved in cell wall biosynthesis